VLFSTSSTSEKYSEPNKKREVFTLSSLQPLTLWVLIVSFIIGGVMGLMNEYLYIFLYEVHSLTKSELGYVLTLATLLGVFSSILSGYLSDRFGIRRILVLILMLSSVALLLLGVSSSRLIVALSLAAVLLAVRAVFPLTRNIAVAGSLAYAGTVVGISNTLSSAGSSIFPLAAGYIYDALEGEIIFGIDGRAVPLVLSSLSVLFLAFLSPFARDRR